MDETKYSRIRMMKMNRFLYILVVSFMALLVSCEDDDSIFSGDENFITSFRLLQDGNAYTGLVSGDTLLLLVPENVSLEGAKVEIVCSENASVSPDPAEVENWGEAFNFTVTSYNNNQRVYKYMVTRTVLASEGDVRLTTPEEVEAFAARGIGKIEGNLVIGKLAGSVKEDSLTSIAALSALKEVTGVVTINPTYRGTSLDGLQNLQRAGGFVMTPRPYENGPWGIRFVREVNLPNLQAVGGDFTISADTLYNLNLPALESVSGNFNVQTWKLGELDFSALKAVGANFYIMGRQSSSNIVAPEEIVFPSLAVVGNRLDLTRIYNTRKIAFPVLQSVGVLYLETMEVVEEFDFSQLTSVSDQITLQWTHRVKEFNLPNLRSAGGFRVYYIEDLETIDLHNLATLGQGGLNIEVCYKLASLDLSALTSVVGKYELKSGVFTDMKSLQALKEVGGDFTFSSMSGITAIDGFSNLTSVGGNFTLSDMQVAVSFTGFSRLETIGGNMFLSNLNEISAINGLTALRSVGKPLSLSGMKKLESFTLLAQLQTGSLTTCSFSGLDALQELDLTGLTTATVTISASHVITLKGKGSFEGAFTLNKVPGMNFVGFDWIGSLNINDVPVSKTDRVEYNFSGVKQLGTLNITQGYSENKGVIRLPDLEVVDNAMKLTEGQGARMRVQPTEYPKLKKVGSMTYVGAAEALRFPALEEVTGSMEITTSFVNGMYPTMLEEIYTPVLKRVGKLVMTSRANDETQYNTTITDLDCFSALERVDVIDIHKQGGLVSFKGLEKAIGSLDDEMSWLVGGNAYNPTFEEAKAGKLVKP